MDYRKLPDHSRVWVYQANRAFTENEMTLLKGKTNLFIANWASHGAAINAAIEVFYNRFIVVFADESDVTASGCSQDSLTGLMREIQQEFGVNMFDRLQIAYKQDSEIKTLTMAEFKEQLKANRLNENTAVFNNLVTNKADFISNWETTIKNSWHKQLV